MIPGSNPPHSRAAVIVLLIGAAAIAFAPILVRLSEVGPVATGLYRMAISLPVFWLWVLAIKPLASRAVTAADRGYLLLAGIFFAGDLAFWHWSIELTSVANATLLANFAPIFVTLGGLLFFGERFSKTFYAGLIAAIVGVAVLLGDSAMLGTRNLLGDGLGIITAIFYAAYILLVGRLRAVFSTATVMAWSGLSASAILAIMAYFSGEELLAVSAFGWLVLALLALGSHAGGQTMIAYALAHLPAAFSSVALLLQPAIAAILAWIILNEPLGAIQFLGGAIVLVGIYLARRGSREGQPQG